MQLDTQDDGLTDSMTTYEVAKELGVAVRSIQLWLDAGVLEGWKTPGGHRRIYRASFEQLLEKRNKQASPADKSTAQKPQKKHKLKIFVVEDDDVMLKLYRMTIDSWELPLEVKCYNNGWAGLVAISQSKPDLLIIDLRMPEMNGFSMLKALINSNEFQNMSILVVTGLDAHEIEEKGGLPEGVLLFGKKPVPFQEIKQFTLNLIEKTLVSD